MKRAAGEGVDKSKRDNKLRSEMVKMFDLMLRVWHVATASVLFGGLFWGVQFTRLTNWHRLTIWSGVAIIVASICRSRHWPYQGRGVTAALHVGLLWLLHGNPEARGPLLMAVLISGVIGSHLPGNIRHWSLLHGRRID